MQRPLCGLVHVRFGHGEFLASSFIARQVTGGTRPTFLRNCREFIFNRQQTSAVQSGAILMTANVRHYKCIPDITLEHYRP